MAVLRARVCVFVGVCVLACPCLCGCGCGFACIFSCMTTTSCTAALNIGDSVGSIEQGKVGDIVVCVLRRLWRWLWLPPSSGVLLCRFDVPQWEHVIYQMGDGAPVSRVFKAGECVFNASTK